MSKRELWEIVRADELKVGDVVTHGSTDDYDPRVLRRALEIAATWFANRFTHASPEKEMQDAIDQARRELESEGSDVG